jgi:hypothetical protein
MAFVAVTNVDGSNPGPQAGNLPDTVQSPIGNVWKLACFTVAFTPGTITNAVNAEVTVAVTGLLTTDFVFVNAPGAPGLGAGISGARVSAAGVLAINFTNSSATTTTAMPTGPYIVFVARPQPNWTKPATGSSIDW